MNKIKQYLGSHRQTAPLPSHNEFLKYVGLFLISPYQEIWRRIKLKDLKILHLLFVTLIILILLKFFFLKTIINFYWANALLPLIFKPHFIIKWWKIPFFYLIFHVFYTVLGRKNISEGKNREKNLLNLGFKDEEGNPLCAQEPYYPSKLVTVYPFHNPFYTVEEFKAKEGNLKTAFKTSYLEFRYGKEKDKESKKMIENRQIIELICRKAGLLEKYPFKEAFSSELKEYEFIIGETASGKRLTISLLKMVHMLIAGETSSGKSSFYRQMIYTLLKGSHHISFYLIDLKGGVEFNLFQGIKNIHVVDNNETAVTHLESLTEEIKRRLNLFKQEEVENIDAYHEKNKDKKMDRIIILADEAAELFSTSPNPSIDKDLVQTARAALSQIARQARAAGIHFIFSSQRIDKNVIPSEAKDNFGTHLCFKVNSPDASINMLGRKEAYDLDPIAGRAIFKDGLKLQQLQTPWLSHRNAKDLLKDFYSEELLQKLKEVKSKRPSHEERVAQDTQDEKRNVPPK